MKIGYQDPYDNYNFEDGIYVKNNYLYIITINDFNNISDFLDLNDVIGRIDVSFDLEGIIIYGNQAEILNIDKLKKYKKLKYIHIRNMKLMNLNFLMDLDQLETLKISSTMGLDMKGSFYHPIGHLMNLKFLDVSFSSFSDDAIYISKNKTIFDNLIDLEYLNLRETSIQSTSFISLIKSERVLLNYIDNNVRLDFNQYKNIRLVTTISSYFNGSLMDISRYIGNY